MRLALVLGSFLLGAILFGLLFSGDPNADASEAAGLGPNPGDATAASAESLAPSGSETPTGGALDVVQATAGSAREAVAQLEVVLFTGRILDLEGEPRGDKPFRIFLGDQEQRIRTKRDGTFYTEPLRLSTRDLRVYATWLVEHGTNAFELNLQVPDPVEGQVALGDLTPEPLFQGISGRVVGPLGEPVADAGIAGGGGTTRSDDQGNFRLMAPRDEFAVRARGLSAGSSDRVFVQDGRSGVLLQLGVRANPLLRLSSSDPALLEHVELKVVELPVRKELNLYRGSAHLRGEWMLPRSRSGEVELTFSHALTGVVLWTEVVTVEPAAEGEGYLAGGRTLERALERHCGVATVQLTCRNDAWEVARALASSSGWASNVDSESPFRVDLGGEPWRTVLPAGSSMPVAFQALSSGDAYSPWDPEEFELSSGFQTLELAGPLEVELIFGSDPRGDVDLEKWTLSVTNTGELGRDAYSQRRAFRSQVPAFEASGRLRTDERIRLSVPRPGRYTLQLANSWGVFSGARSTELEGVIVSGDASRLAETRVIHFTAQFEVSAGWSEPIRIDTWD
jgi:hypothetical protein